MSVSNDQLYEILCDIKGDVGEIKASAAGTHAWLAKHVEDDAAMARDIKTLQLSGARQKGFMTALAATGSALGAGLGYLVEYLHRG